MSRLYRSEEADVGTTARKALTPFLSAGDTYGHLTALRPIPPVHPGVGSTQIWKFRCDCGAEIERIARNVTRSKNASCGCDHIKARVDVVGQRFGRWVVVADSDERPGNRRSVSCVCDCGGEALVNVCHLRSGRSVSCGCYKQEIAGRAAFKHGYGGKNSGRGASSEYRIWSLMKGRCSNSNIPEYANYGGRGIKVCERWSNDFTAFLADMGPRPSKRHSIDRIDVNGNYCPENCRWATAKEQANNTRRNVHVEIFGQRLTFAQAYERYARGGISQKAARDRLRRGQSIEEALRLT